MIQDYNDTTDVWQDDMTLQYISLLTEVLVLKFIDNCLQCLGTMTATVTIKWVWIICTFFKSEVSHHDLPHTHCSQWCGHWTHYDLHIIIIEALEEVAWEVLSTLLFDRPLCPSNFHLFGLPKYLIWGPGPLTCHSFLLRALKKLCTVCFTAHTAMNRFGRWFYTEIDVLKPLQPIYEVQIEIKFWNSLYIPCIFKGPGWHSQYSESLRAGPCGVLIPSDSKIFCTHPAKPWSPPNLLSMGTGSLQWVKRCDVVLITNPHLVLRFKKE